MVGRRRLGGLGLPSGCPARRHGNEVAGGSPALGSPGRWVIKKVVAGIKALAREFFRGDPEMLPEGRKGDGGRIGDDREATGGDRGEAGVGA